MTVLHVPSFGGGVVRLGSPNVQRTDELLVADALDIGPRGQLVVASEVSDYYTLEDLAASPAPWDQLYGLGSMLGVNQAFIAALGEGDDGAGTNRFLAALLERTGATVPLPAGRVLAADATSPVPDGTGVVVTMESGPVPRGSAGYIYLFVNIGAREGSYPKAAPGLYVLAYDQAGGVVSFVPIKSFGASLGAGTSTKQLHFRGIVGYNNHVFGYGFDAADATNGDAPRRVMFCNQGDGITWGNDNQGGAANRAFTDSDAIVLGDAGEIIRGAIAWDSRLWFGTNRQLHYIQGYGRDSYLTDGSNPVARSQNIVGAHALIEGPDRLLYGVSDQGLWAFDGGAFEPHWRRLVDYAGRSSGYWDLIWTDPTAAAGYPGRTNQDLVWTVVDWDREQIVVGIPFCNASAGAGAGSDTVLIKFHVRTGGFTRQVFAGVCFSSASYERRLAQDRETRILGTATASQVTLQRYGYQATPTDAPPMPVVLPSASFGPYLPFGPDGVGVLRRAYLTLAWGAATSLPIVFTITVTGDDETVDNYTLTVSATAPGSPVDGDVWVDTSETDTAIGNATAGAILPARRGYLVKFSRGGAWRRLAGGGDRGARMTIPLPLTRTRAARTTVTATCTAAAGRFEIEDLGINPGSGAEAA